MTTIATYRSIRDPLLGRFRIEAKPELDFYQSGRPWQDDPELVAALRAEAAAVDLHNRVVHRAYTDAWRTFAAAFRAHELEFEPSSPSPKQPRPTRRGKLLQELAPVLPRSAVQDVDDNLRFWREDRERDRRAQSAYDSQRAREAKQVRAAVFLVSRGFDLVGDNWCSDGGTTSHGPDTVSIANNVRFRELVAGAQAVPGDLHSFPGNDNCTNCGGWDGLSTRCECGDRRVCWDRSGDFEDMAVYPSIY